MKIISGGQTGADLGGVEAGRALGFEVGGTMPSGFRTLEGDRPEFAELYGMVAHTSREYPPRTAANVKNSDGTMCFASNWKSYGEICTKKWINKYKKPWFDVDIRNPKPPAEARAWLQANNIRVLNVAGNAEATSPGIQRFVVQYLQEVFNPSAT